MGYKHITNLYRPEVAAILDLRRVYALEKVHGTSAGFDYDATRPAGQEIIFHAGGESHPRFVALFNYADLLERFKTMGHKQIRVYGEAYGGKQQAMSGTYGKELCFIGFEVQVGEAWLNVPNADNVITQKLGLEFVPYELVDCTMENLNRERDRPSVVAEWRGMGTDKKREGIVIRPTVELWLANGERLMSKHKGADFQERQNQPAGDIDPAKLEVLKAAEAIAFEWVNDTRLDHILDKLTEAQRGNITSTGLVIKAMVADVYREAKGEIVESKEAAQAIGRRASALFKARVTAIPPTA